jgi:hypothetical protein
MIERLKLRTIYALHMLAPVAFVAWHIQRLSSDTIQGLSRMFALG